MRKKIGLNVNVVMTFMVLTGLIIFMFIPVYGKVKAPAFILKNNVQDVYMSEEFMLREVLVEDGDVVRKGDVLFIGENDNLDRNIDIVENNLKALSWKLDHIAVDKRRIDEKLVTFQELELEKEKYEGLMKIKENLTIRAKFDGKIIDLYKSLIIGNWYKNNVKLCSIEPKTGNHKLVAFVKEKEMGRIKLGDVGYFYSDIDDKKFNVKLVEKERFTVKSLYQYRFMASVYGGKIATRINKSDDLVPNEAMYKVFLEIVPQKESKQVLAVSKIGDVYIKGKPESYFSRIVKVVSSVWVKESNF